MNQWHLKHIFKSESTSWIFLVFIIYIIYLPFSGYDFLVHDSLNYYEYSSSFLSGDRKFSFLNYSNSLRGYLFSFILLPIKGICFLTKISPIHFTRIFGALCASFLFGYAIPELWQIVSKTKLTRTRRIALIILTFLLWRDYFNYPLTDFPAILCLLLSLILIFNKQDHLSYLAAGIFLACAVNLRPLYLIVLPVYILAVIIIDNKKNNNKLLRILIFAFGFGVISLPQFLINIRHFSTYSLFVTGNYNQESNLYLKQLMWGIQYQKYETSIDSTYQSPRMYFIDIPGTLFIKMQNVEDINNIKDYLNLIYKDPIYFIKSYGKHFFNGLDLQYSTPYIKDVFRYNKFLTWLNYTILFLSLIMLWSYRKWRFNKMNSLVFFITLLPCLVVLPIAIETRFLLPLHLLIYAVVCFGWPEKWQWKLLPGTVKISLSLFYLIFISTCYWLSYTTQITLEFGPRVFW